MGTYVNDLKGKLGMAIGGIGPRIVTGQIAIGPASEAVHAGKLDLRTIHAFFPIKQAGTMFNVVVNAPGSIDNYASVTFSRMAMTGTLALKAITSGSKTFRYMAMGE